MSTGPSPVIVHATSTSPLRDIELLARHLNILSSGGDNAMPIAEPHHPLRYALAKRAVMGQAVRMTPPNRVTLNSFGGALSNASGEVT